MKTKIFSLLMACFLLLTLCTACSSNAMPMETPPMTDNFGAVASTPGAFGAPEYDAGEIYEEGGQPVSSKPIENTDAPADYAKKIVRNADLRMEVVGVEECYKKLIAWAEQNSGYESSHRMENYGGSSHVYAVIKIKAEKLDDFLNHAGTLGKVLSSTTSSDDVTAQYYDLETRLKTMRTTLDKYYEFLKATTTVKEMLEVQNSIDGLILEIESVEGTLRYMKAQVAESTVTITMSEQPDPIKQEEEIDWNALSFGDMLTLTLRSVVKLGNVLISILQWIFISSPYLILLLLLYFAVRFIVKRYRKKHPKKARPAPVPVYYAPVPPAVPASAPTQPEPEPTEDK